MRWRLRICGCPRSSHDGGCAPRSLVERLNEVNLDLAKVETDPTRGEKKGWTEQASYGRGSAKC